MAGDQFQLQELNPFLEWHLHATATSLEGASEEAKKIARVIGRKTPSTEQGLEIPDRNGSVG